MAISKQIMTRSFHDSHLYDPHHKDSAKRSYTYDAPVYTLLRHIPELFDCYQKPMFTIVAAYGNGVFNNWIFEDAYVALRCFRAMVGAR